MIKMVDIVIPVLNEEAALPICIDKLFSFIDDHPERVWRIIVADNGSTDRTADIADDLANDHLNVFVMHLELRGRGRALKHAWGNSEADVRVYMDVDLSTDLRSLPDLVSAIVDDGHQIAIGSRLTNGSKVVGRTLKREITSRCYNMMIQVLFPHTKWKDAQCGFKAISGTAAENILPLIKDNAWFFDTELLLLADKAGYSLKEIPVHWRDDPDTRVKIISTAWQDIKGLMRLRFKGRPVPPSAP